MNTYLTHTADAQLTGFKKPLISSGLWRKHTISSTEAPSTFVDAYLAALDKVCMGLCHVTRSGYVVHANKAAIELIDRSPLVGITSKNCLTFKDRQLSMRVQSGIAEAQKSDSDDVKSINAFLCGGLAGCSNSRLIVEISATRKALRKVTDLLGEVLVSLTDPDSVHALSTERIGILYKLSPAEKEVCTLYVSGFTRAEIATRRGVSTETIKAQLRSIGEKTSAPTRHALTQLALKLSPPVLL